MGTLDHILFSPIHVKLTDLWLHRQLMITVTLTMITMTSS